MNPFNDGVALAAICAAKVDCDVPHLQQLAHLNAVKDHSVV